MLFLFSKSSRTFNLAPVGQILYLKGFESRWSLDFFRLLLSNCLNWKFTAMIILHFDLQPQFKYMNNFIYTSHHVSDVLPVKAGDPITIILISERKHIRGWHGVSYVWLALGFNSSTHYLVLCLACVLGLGGVYVKRGTHLEPTGTCRNHPESNRNHPEPHGTYPEPAETTRNHPEPHRTYLDPPGNLDRKPK